MSVTLRQLQVFMRVAESGHVTNASSTLFISQSAVSMALAELEKETGGALFERRGRRLLLNERGRLLLDEAQEILARTERVVTLLRESADKPAGVIRIGASTTIGNYLLPTLVGEFTHQFQHVEIRLQVVNTEQVEQGVVTGELDVGLIEGFSHATGLDITRWRDDELAVVVGKGHPWWNETLVVSEQLAEGRWLMREKGSGTREVFEAAMAAASIRFKIEMELGHTEAIKKAVESGLGIGCLSRLAVQRELDLGVLKEVMTPVNFRRSLLLIVRQDRQRTRLFMAFLEFLAKGAGVSSSDRKA